ncbi:arylsulfotransferase family protein [Haloprofundus halobius]|uniref:arylsulfotransferase family protein n=1 Tax=Haloprofundus halobius TaxID=2876194 RepID=UPI001CCD397B|nr:arylsulfotransferase family protein [Haloprofundus halobius]
MITKRSVRFAFLLVAALCALSVSMSYLGAVTADQGSISAQAELPAEEREAIVGEQNNTTVFSTAPRGTTSGALVAYDTDGRTQYYNDSLTHYFDIDPVPGTTDSVEYVAGKDLSQTECPAIAPEGCSRIVVERVNLSTGEVDRELTRYSRKAVWHDVDRLNETHLLVADIGRDRVFVIDTETGIVEWEWDAQADIPLSEGGAFPSDWTHLNDVEYVGDGRVMASLRNQDQVVFIDMEEGYMEDWTLGEDNDYDTLYEQHNPDYIPEERGGPAVLVADSENNRVVEYQREDGEWVQTWEWQDSRVQWPRDADRLPNGNTLITDSDGGRVVEVNQQGEIVWSTEADTPYEAERLETGDESSGGESAERLGLDSRTTDDVQDEASNNERAELLVKGLYPKILLNGLLFMFPPWVGPLELTGMLVFVLTLLVWALAEFRWSRWDVSVSIRRPE